MILTSVVSNILSLDLPSFSASLIQSLSVSTKLKLYKTTWCENDFTAQTSSFFFDFSSSLLIRRFSSTNRFYNSNRYQYKKQKALTPLHICVCVCVCVCARVRVCLSESSLLPPSSCVYQFPFLTSMTPALVSSTVRQYIILLPITKNLNTTEDYQRSFHLFFFLSSCHFFFPQNLTFTR